MPQLTTTINRHRLMVAVIENNFNNQIVKEITLLVLKNQPWSDFFINYSPYF